MGCWSEKLSVGETETADWHFKLNTADGSHFGLYQNAVLKGEVNWTLTGKHNAYNGMMAIIAARHVGIDVEHAIAALGQFSGVKRRMELVGEIGNISVFDDFAHHPTAIATTLEGLRNSVGDEKIIAVIEPRSNTMRLGCHREKLANSVALANVVVWYKPEDLNWPLDDILRASATATKNLVKSQISSVVDTVIDSVKSSITGTEKAHIVIMSNGGFGGVHKKILARLAALAG